MKPEVWEARRKGIGSSDVAAVCGLNPWKSPHDVWLDKMGVTEQGEETEATEFGKRAEGMILQWMADRRPDEIKTYLHNTGDDAKIYKSPDNELVIAQPDGIANVDTKDEFVLEAKTAGHRSQEMWTDPTIQPDGVPAYYMPQVMWEMAATGHKTKALLGALVDRKFWVYDIQWSQALFDAMLAKVEPFWEKHVLTQTPPPIEDYNNARAQEWLKNFYRAQNGQDLVTLAGDEHDRAQAIAKRYAQASAELSQWENIKKAARAELQDIIRDQAGIQGRGWKATWKQVKEKESTDWQKLALSFGPTDEQIKKHTESKPGHRTIRVTIKGE